MTQVVALARFDHGGNKAPGETFECSPQAAAALEKKRLVDIISDGPAIKNPSTSAGAKLSASPVDPALPEQTVIKSKRGKRKGKATESS